MRSLFKSLVPITSIVMHSVSHPGLDEGLMASLKKLERGRMHTMQEVLELHQTQRNS